MERQKTWGWMVALYLFLAGVGGGVFLFSFILNVRDMYEPVARIGALVGPLLVIAGTMFLMADLGTANRTYRLFITPSAFRASWIARGTWILTVFIILGLLYALPGFGAFQWLPWSQQTGVGLGFGIVAVVLSLFVIAYPGFLLGVAKGIPFWNSSILPPLFFLSGLDTGVALLALISLFFSSFGAEGLHLLGIADISIIVLLLIVLGAYIEISRQSGTVSVASLRLLKTPLFIVGVILVGLVLPLALLIYSIFLADFTLLRVLAGINSIFLLAGGLLLRYSIVRAGIPISFLE